MARKLRLEFPGAIYHVLNRGNYRSWVFNEESTKAAFEQCLFEACERCEWVLHAFVVMGNHFHAAIETPQGNLTVGMQWLQSTFANRFNAFRGERGHLFQGRFKSLLVEEGDALGQVCHYLHLNPVRAKIVSAEKLPEYRHSSLWYLSRPKLRPSVLHVDAALRAAGELPDSAAGWNRYLNYLEWQAEDGPLGKNRAYASLSRGWAIGSDSFKQALIKDEAVLADSRAWESGGAAEVRSARWTTALEIALEKLPKDSRTATEKSAPWKVAVAAFLKETTDVANGWLAEKLDMGSGFYLSKHVGLLRKNDAGEGAHWLAHLRKVKGKA